MGVKVPSPRTVSLVFDSFEIQSGDGTEKRGHGATRSVPTESW